MGLGFNWVVREVVRIMGFGVDSVMINCPTIPQPPNPPIPQPPNPHPHTEGLGL